MLLRSLAVAQCTESWPLTLPLSTVYNQQVVNSVSFFLPSLNPRTSALGANHDTSKLSGGEGSGDSTVIDVDSRHTQTSGHYPIHRRQLRPSEAALLTPSVCATHGRSEIH